jgi:hypothetical protein
VTLTSNALVIQLLHDEVDIDIAASKRGCWVCDRSGFAGRALKAVCFSDLMNHPVDVDKCEDYWRNEGTI